MRQTSQPMASCSMTPDMPLTMRTMMKKTKLGVRKAAHPVVVPWADSVRLLAVSLAGSDKSVRSVTTPF
jgi:hypothetical protein